MNKLFLLALLVCCLLVPGSVALSQPYSSFMPDSTIVPGPTLDGLCRARVAFGPHLGLVTWVAGEQLLGARIDRTGVLLDTFPIEIEGPSANSYINMRPGLEWGDGRFLAVWTEYASDRVRCAAVDTNGHVVFRRVLDSAGVPQNAKAAAAFDGTNFLAAWSAVDETDTLRVFFSRISPTGAMLDSPPRKAAPSAHITASDVDLCFHNGRYLAIWNQYDSGGLWGSFILPDGTVPDSGGFEIEGGDVRWPAVTHDRQNYVISWYEPDYKTKLARVTDSGQVLDPAGVEIDHHSLWENDVYSTGDTTWVAYCSDSLYGSDRLRLTLLRVDTALRALGAPVALAWPSRGYTEERGPASPSIAAIGDSFVVVWSQPRRDTSVYDGSNAWFRRLNQQGQFLDSAPILASYGANRQESPDVASDGADFLAVWVDTRYDSTSTLSRTVVGQRLSADGEPLDSQPFRIGGSGALDPALAFGGGCYMAVWCDQAGIYAARISTAGALLDSVPLHVVDPAAHWYCPDIAYGDSLFLAVWMTVAPYRVHGVRITPAGAILDTAPLLLQVDTQSRPILPQVAYDGDNFLVVRHDGTTSPDEFRCVRVSPAGQLLDSLDLNIDTAVEGSRPNLAYGGGVYLAVDSRSSSCWRISPDGSMLGPVSHAYPHTSQVVYDGTDFMLLCEMRDSAYQITDTLGAMRITPGGEVLDQEPFVLVTAGSSPGWPPDAAIAANGVGRVAVVLKSFEPGPYLANRVRAAAFPAVLGIRSQRDAGLPVEFRVQPNPASRRTSLSFVLGRAGPVQVTAFDATGRRSSDLFSGRMNAGRHTIPLDARHLANGVYFLRLESEAATLSMRLVITH